MIDIYTNGAQVTVDKMKQYLGSPFGAFLYALVTGAIGIAILLGFLSMFVSAAALPMSLAALIAFNSAAGGYSLTDKSTSTGRLPIVSLCLLALLLTLAGCLTLLFFCPWENLLDSNRIVICTTTALIFTFLGAWIARKSKNINRS